MVARREPFEYQKRYEAEFIEYDTKVLQVSVEIANRSLRDSKEASATMTMARREMIERLAEKMYDALEFHDDERHDSDSVVLSGKISVNIRRK